MTRSGDEYVRGLRDGRAVMLNGERVADVTTHPAFAGGIRTVAQLYDLAHDPANRELMTSPSPRDGRPINKSWLVPRTRESARGKMRALAAGAALVRAELDALAATPAGDPRNCAKTALFP